VQFSFLHQLHHGKSKFMNFDSINWICLELYKVRSNDEMSAMLKSQLMSV